jgi:hypothetical protein
MKILQKICFKVFLIIIVILSTGCQKKVEKKFYPYQFNTEKFKTINKKVFLVPTGLFDVVSYVPPNTPKGITDLCKTIDEYLGLYLLKNNYEVVSSNRVKSIWENIKNKNGGFFSSETGKVSEEKYLKVVGETILKLRKEIKFDSIIIPNLDFKSIQMLQLRKRGPYETAVWDGVQRDSLRLLNPWTRHDGVSLKVNIKSDVLNDILLNKGGIDIVSYNKISYDSRGKSYTIEARDLIEISQEKVLESISIALHPFVISDYHNTK